MLRGSSATDNRPSYIRYCAMCDHPEGDHGGQANWHGPRRGSCFREGCECSRFEQTNDHKETS